MMPFEHRHLHHVLTWIRLNGAVFHFQVQNPFIIPDPIRNDFDHTSFHRVAAVRSVNPEAFRRDRMTHMHSVINGCREPGLSDFHRHGPVFCNHFPVNNRPGNADIIQVAEENDVRALARSNAAHLMIHPEAGRRVDGHILDGFDGIQSLPNRAANNMIQVSFID